MTPKVIMIIVAIVVVIVIGMVMTMKKAVKPRDYDPGPPKTAPKK